MSIKVKRALISVSDKTGLVELGLGLRELGVEILSTGGTAKLLAEKGIPVTEVSEYTGFPEMMEGRVKTLHPKIHGGLLGRRGIDDEAMAAQGIQPIDLVVVNLYPFEQTVARPDCDLETAIENIDIGGPTLIRAAAKNHAAVAVLVEPADYGEILEELKVNQCAVSKETRFRLAVKGFRHTAHYDVAIADYLAQLKGTERDAFPAVLNLHFHRAQTMRYGENPHQRAAFYTARDAAAGTLARAKQLQGKALSYNNIADADAALECVKVFADLPACVIVKHANPCGVAQANTLLEAYEGAYATDPTSAFGGIIAFNRLLDADTARAIIDRQFVEVILAPSITSEAQSALAAKANVRLLAVGQWPSQIKPEWDFKRITGGLLVQDKDLAMVSGDEMRVVTERQPTEREMRDLIFVWKTVKFVKSNAIVYGRDRRTLGIGAGQMSRVYAAKIAALKAVEEGLSIEGAVMASDAFFPFRDSIDAAAEAGVAAVIQPGSSMRDQEVIDAADEHAMAMVFTGMRHFRH